MRVRSLSTLSSLLLVLVLATACGSNVPEGATSGSGGDALSDATATTSSSDESSSVAVASSSSGTGGGSAETCSPSNACGALPNCAPFVSANKDGGLTAEGGNLSKIKNGTYFMTWFWNGKTQQDFTFATTLTIAGDTWTTASDAKFTDGEIQGRRFASQLAGWGGGDKGQYLTLVDKCGLDATDPFTFTLKGDSLDLYFTTCVASCSDSDVSRKEHYELQGP